MAKIAQIQECHKLDFEELQKVMDIIQVQLY